MDRAIEVRVLVPQSTGECRLQLPVAQGTEQRPSKPERAGSNPAGQALVLVSEESKPRFRGETAGDCP